MTSTDTDREPGAERLEQMKNDFLAAQQRRRNSTPAAAARPDETGKGPDLAGPAPDRRRSVAMFRP